MKKYLIRLVVLTAIVLSITAIVRWEDGYNARQEEKRVKDLVDQYQAGIERGYMNGYYAAQEECKTK